MKPPINKQKVGVKTMIDKQDLTYELEFIEGHNIWISALFSSIKTALKEDRTYQAEKLAEIGQYLADDSQYHIDKSLKSTQPIKGLE